MDRLLKGERAPPMVVLAACSQRSRRLKLDAILRNQRMVR
jgi:hypothetical protein